MFRPMQKKDRQLSQTRCMELLETEPRGVLSLVGDGGYPYGLPMNFWYCRETGKLYFHCGKIGHKLNAIREQNKASFCVYDRGWQKAGDWALMISSVIVFGRIRILEDPREVIAITRRLSRKYTSDEAYIEAEIEKYGAAAVCLELTVEHMTGKLVHEA